ncbi:PPOX class probable F420-dependent enzyme [Herbihabitans rhizosphaerae]|uniref:PPOX class probable F420-dependent enzyme n=1 Tax=Herbihabitans rhizosphaerae TaxID=1872711 RepID=A0A4V2EUM8_9PSEU|nr:PPOX class F420-dependent oxidoreductase [Herbihabitans rhizosphaerae]RZS45123.1 PPOX class probable F420-dependent enzyme [Herbihabitans rhizosphaerae]
MSKRDDPNGDRFFALRTFRRDGTVVSTPIWLAHDGGRWFAYTPGRSWKVRRIQRNSRVEVARSDFDGDPSGEWHSGTARILTGPELSAARRAMRRKYRSRFRLFRLMTFLMSWRNGRAVGLEIDLEGLTAAEIRASARRSC